MIFRFENCTLDIDRRELRRGGLLCSLEPKAFDLLEYLIRNRERVVSKDDLVAAVWGGRTVSDAALDTRISVVRDAIGDSGAEQRLIRTLRTIGFRFIAPMVEEAPSTTARIVAEERNRALRADHPTIAVLPFANLSGDQRHNSFADGMTEDFIAALSRVSWLLVTSRASSFSFKGQAIDTVQAGRKLGVRYLLEGSTRQIAGRQRVTVQLVDAIADRQMWTQQYDQDVRDGFEFNDEVCDKVVGAIAPQLFLAEYLRVQCKTPVSLNGWDRLVRAVSLLNSRDQKNVAAASALLRQAIAIDPRSAHNHGLLSIATTLPAHMGWAARQKVIPAALAEARKALSLNPDEPWAHAALGYALIWKQPHEAMAPCQRAIALNPNFAVAHYFLAIALTQSGNCDHAFAHADTAERLAQRDLLAHGYTGAADNVRAAASFGIENYRDGIDFARKAIACSPNLVSAYRCLLVNLALNGQSDEASLILQSVRRLCPNITALSTKQDFGWMPPAKDRARKRYAEAFRIAGL
jgi:TolB-like protein/tetratricopeptide (TPR) repeat protein